MPRPGIVITSRAEAPPRSAPTNVGMTFLVGPTASGDATPTVVHSLTEYETAYGVRVGYTEMWDAADAAFHEGAPAITVSKTNVATASYPDALAALTADLGPGQVLAPASQSSTTHGLLLAHAEANNRIALLDALVDDDTVSELVTSAGLLRGDSGARYGALFVSPVTIPGIAGGTIRTVPYSAIVAGILARNDASLSPNVAAAGINGRARYALDVTLRFTDAERETLNDAGVNVARSLYGEVVTYGFRTLADPLDGWGYLSNARLNMQIVALASQIAERYVFSQLDGRGITISQFGAELTAMLVPFYEAGSLYGSTAAEAFYVNVGPQVNTQERIAAGELHAVLVLRMSGFAELVTIEIVKVAVDTAIAVPA
jgi:hypothetical protein